MRTHRISLNDVTFVAILILHFLLTQGVQESHGRLLPVAFGWVMMHVEVCLQFFVEKPTVHTCGLVSSLPKILLVLSLVEPVLVPELLVLVVALVLEPEDVRGCSLFLILI